MNLKMEKVKNLFILLVVSVVVSGCKKVVPVVADFSASVTEALTGDNVQFTNASENAYYYQWDFGDGGSSFDSDPAHVFEDDGRYDVELIAIGDDDSDTATLEIDVYRPYDISIFEGTGIEDVYVSDVWSNARSVYTSDTIYFRDYLENLELYRHIVFYPDEGVAYFLFNEDTVIANEDPLVFIMVLAPYIGGTTKRVGLGSTMKRVKDTYGNPEGIDEGSGFLGYWYDSQGVDFYAYESGYVEEIYIYSNSAKKLATSKELLREGLIHFWIDF